MGWMPISPWRPLAGKGQNLTFGAAAVNSTAFGDSVQAVQISAITSNCHVAVGPAGTSAVNTDMLVKASDPPLIIRIAPGEEVSVIQDTATGTLNVVEITH